MRRGDRPTRISTIPVGLCAATAQRVSWGRDEVGRQPSSLTLTELGLARLPRSSDNVAMLSRHRLLRAGLRAAAATQRQRRPWPTAAMPASLVSVLPRPPPPAGGAAAVAASPGSTAASIAAVSPLSSSPGPRRASFRAASAGRAGHARALGGCCTCRGGRRRERRRRLVEVGCIDERRAAAAAAAAPAVAAPAALGAAFEAEP